MTQRNNYVTLKPSLFSNYRKDSDPIPFLEAQIPAKFGTKRMTSEHFVMRRYVRRLTNKLDSDGERLPSASSRETHLSGAGSVDDQKSQGQTPKSQRSTRGVKLAPIKKLQNYQMFQYGQEKNTNPLKQLALFKSPEEKKEKSKFKIQPLINSVTQQRIKALLKSGSQSKFGSTKKNDTDIKDISPITNRNKFSSKIRSRFSSQDNIIKWKLEQDE